MRATFLLCLILLGFTAASAQNLYVKTFGSTKKPAVIFLHGGPGYNAATFEATTAQKLADSGFYVIVYDRRGEGRSKDSNAAFTLQQSVSDVDSIIISFHLKRVSLIGHSFGGLVGARYAEKYPKKIQALVLVGAPIVFQESFRTIIRNSRQRSLERNDTTGLKFLDKLEKMDTSGIMYSSAVFGQAMKNGLYSPNSRTEASKKIFVQIKADSSLGKLANSMTPQAAMGFYRNEKYTTMDMRPELKKLVEDGILVYGLYGQEDGLYSEAQVRELAKIIGPDRLKYIAGSSHNVFIDQQSEFISALKSWVK